MLDQTHQDQTCANSSYREWYIKSLQIPAGFNPISGFPSIRQFPLVSQNRPLARSLNPPMTLPLRFWTWCAEDSGLCRYTLGWPTLNGICNNKMDRLLRSLPQWAIISTILRPCHFSLTPFHRLLCRLLKEDDVMPHPGMKSRELIIPLTADAIFFETLSTTIENMSAHLLTVQKDFMNALENLARNISLSARPSSATAVFRPHSRLTTRPWAVHASSKTKVVSL